MCLFCSIIKGDIPSSRVYEDEWVYAFRDIDPKAPEHLLIVTKKHIDSLAEVQKEDIQLLGHVQYVASQIAHTLGVADNGFRLVNNCGEQGGQTVQHLHYHFLAGRSMQWPPG